MSAIFTLPPRKRSVGGHGEPRKAEECAGSGEFLSLTHFRHDVLQINPISRGIENAGVRGCNLLRDAIVAAKFSHEERTGLTHFLRRSGDSRIHQFCGGKDSADTLVGLEVRRVLVQYHLL
jgi:hypothetical protein